MTRSHGIRSLMNDINRTLQVHSMFGLINTNPDNPNRYEWSLMVFCSIFLD
jgi:alanine-alpha-ketoisovalerate/valine-pyruvate aminotransferase